MSTEMNTLPAQTATQSFKGIVDSTMHSSVALNESVGWSPRELRAMDTALITTLGLSQRNGYLAASTELESHTVRFSHFTPQRRA